MSSKKKTKKPSRPDSRAKAAPRRWRWWHTLTVSLSALLAIALGISAYAGMISPLKHGGMWGIAGLALPAMVIITIAWGVLQLLWCRTGAAVSGLSLVACAGPILSLCPVHVSANKPAEGAFTFTLLEYNIDHFTDLRPEGEQPADYSATLSEVLAADADIAVMVESSPLFLRHYNNVNAEQIDSVYARYPNVMWSVDGIMVFSKFPLEVIPLNRSAEERAKWQVAAYRVSLPDGKLFTLFGVHLQSIYLDRQDRELFVELTHLDLAMPGRIRAQLLDKLATANVSRARQAQELMQLVRHYGGPNVIICGDFNDVAGSYSTRVLDDAGFHSVYPAVGCGPMVTYNANRFYFCIDHVFWRGCFRPLEMTRGDLPCSDHYPLLTRFEITP